MAIFSKITEKQRVTEMYPHALDSKNLHNTVR